MVAANSLPRVALAPLFVLWFGLGIAGKVALVVSLVFFVMLTTTLAGLTQPNRDHEYLARSLGASRRQHILYFVVPAAVPTIVAGLELSLTYSFLGAVAGEIVGGSNGIGVRLTVYANSFEIDKFLALLLLLVIVSTATVQIMRHFRRQADALARRRTGRSVLRGPSCSRATSARSGHPARSRCRRTARVVAFAVTRHRGLGLSLRDIRRADRRLGAADAPDRRRGR